MKVQSNIKAGQTATNEVRITQTQTTTQTSDVSIG